MIRRLFAVAMTLSLLNACQPATNPATGTTPAPAVTDNATSEDLKQAFLTQYATNVHANYLDSHTKAVEMQTAIDAFLSAPDAAKLEAAKSAWLVAREPYGQTEGFRFYDGPIDDENGPEGQLNAWPLDEVYVDYVEGNADAGIVNQTAQYPEINTDLLISLNEAGGDKNISTGYHAIEFLLWGQDLSEGPGAGQRPFTDYTTATNADRRGQYLKAATDLLVSDLQSMVDAWAPGQDNYRKSFLALDVNEAVGKALKGIGTLSASELSAERMATPLDIGDREEEHSCFSDNTRNDILYNARSIENVLMGKYTATDGTVNEGTGLIALIETIDADLAARLKASSAESLALTAAIQDPFDQEIRPENTEGNARITAAINELQNQGRLIVEAGQALGITVNTDL